MKIVGLADSHNYHDRFVIPDGDVLIHGGDALGHGTKEEFEDFLSWYDSLPFQHLLYTPGNHDWFTYNNTELAKKMCSDRGITMLVDEEITINGVRIWLSPWSPEFCGWAWMRQDHEAESLDGEEGLGKYFDMIPEGIDVLVSHGPPFGYLDRAPSSKTSGVGSKELLYAINRVKPKLVLVGHIHEGRKQGDGEGNEYIYWPDGKVTHIANISVLDGRYRDVHKVRTFNI
jgi:Icc-related predicted phosphoesterase